MRVPQQDRSRRTRERVLAAAMRCFEAHGYAETTTAGIAREAGIAVGTLYGYFNDKREILLEVMDQTLRELAKRIIAALDEEGPPIPLAGDGAADDDEAAPHARDPRERARSLIQVVFATQRLRPGMQRILWERYFKDPEVRLAVDLVLADLRAALQRFLETIDPSWVRVDDPAAAAVVVLNAVQWNATQVFIHDDPEATRRAAAAVTDMVDRYLFRDPAAR